MRKGLVRHIISLVFVFGVGGYAYYEYLQTNKSQNTKSEEDYFFTQKLENLFEIKITKQKEVIVLSRKNQDWFLKKPIKDLASFSEVSRWFDEIKNQKVREIFGEGDIAWKDYYLKKYPEVHLKFSDGSSITFLVSSKGSFDEKYFIKKDNRLFIGEKHFFTEVNVKGFDSFRNKKIIPSYGHPIKVVIKNKGVMSFDWANYNWSFKEKDFPLDKKRLDSFWSDLSSLEVSSVKEKAADSSLKKYGLDQPSHQIYLSYSNGKKVTLKISSVRNNQVYVHGSHRNYILKISKDDAEKLKISKNDVRDHGLAFRYQKNKASSLELKSKKVSYSIVNKRNKWISLSSPKKKLDSKKVQILLNSIHELKGKKYKKGKLIKVAGSIIVKDISKKVLLDLKFSPDSGSLVWVQTNLSKDLVALSKSSLDLILKKNIFHSELKEEKIQKEPKNLDLKKKSRAVKDSL